MSVSVTLNGTSYTIPTTGETGWGSAVTAFVQAVATGTLQKSGGAFTLTADADFGATYGLKSAYFVSRTANAATAGAVRLARADAVNWRNEANSANIGLSVNSSNVMTWGGSGFTAPDIKDSTRARALARSTGGATLTANVYSIVDFNSVTTDTRSAIATGAAWKYTVPSGHGGWYLIQANVFLNGGSAATPYCGIFVNGSAILRKTIGSLGTVAGTIGAEIAYQLSAGDYVDFRVFPDASNTRALSTSSNDNWISITRLVSDL